MDKETLEKILEWNRLHIFYGVEDESPLIYQFDLERFLETLVINNK